MKKYFKKDYLIVLLVILLMGVGYFLYNTHSKLTEIVGINIAINDTVTQERNDKGELITKVSLLTTQKTNAFTDLTIRDKEIKYLQKVIRNYTSFNKRLMTAIVIKNKIIASYRDSVNNIIIDSIIVNNRIYPTYYREFSLYNKDNPKDTTRWVYGNTRIGLKTFSTDLVIVSEQDVIIGQERQGVFRPFKTFAIIKNKNPYEKTGSFKAYSKTKMKAKQFGLGVFVGMGVHSGGLGLVIGIGITYNPIRF